MAVLTQDSLPADFLQIAIIARIPPGNVDSFLGEVWDHVHTFEMMSKVDCFRHERRTTINEFVTAAKRMIRAIERVQKIDSDETGDVLFNLHMTPVLSKYPTLAVIKRELTVLQADIKFFSTEALPKRGENRTKVLLKDIWFSAERFGGGLTYDKHRDRGTLTDLIAFFEPILTKLSPTTLDRLRPRR
jgi:hypothetical protein